MTFLPCSASAVYDICCQRTDERMATLSQGNQELLVPNKSETNQSGQRQRWKTPGEFGVSNSVEYDIFPFSALTLWDGRQEGFPACKKTGCWFVGGDDLTGALHSRYLG